MKKNLLSIVILGLLIVNVVLTSVMLFSVSGTMKKTSALIEYTYHWFFFWHFEHALHN